MASNYDNYSHIELIRELHIRDRRIDLLKQELQAIMPTAQSIENSGDNQKFTQEMLTSVNESLSSGNSELNVKTLELTCRLEDISNLLASSGIATLFVDHQLQILCFTPAIIPSIKLTPKDIGQPLYSKVSCLGQYCCLEEDIKAVLDTHVPHESELQTEPDVWYLLRIIPYRILNNSIEGAAITFVDITQSKLAEEELQRNETRLQAIFDTASNGIITINQSGSISTFNPAAELMFGYTEAEVIGRNISELMPSPYREQHDAFLAFYLKSGKLPLIGKSLDVVGQRKEGATFPMNLSIAEFFDGNERFFTGIVQDISDRKTAEMALLESEELLTYAMDASGLGIWDWDIVNGWAMHNYKWFELLGLSRDDTAGSPKFCTTLLHQDDREAVFDRIQQALEGDGRYRSEHRLRRTDGQFIWVLERGSVVKRDEQGKPQRMVGSFADITERKQLEMALRESEARFRQITESLPQLIWTCEPDGACDYLSRQWIQFTGIPSADQLGFNWLRQIHPADKKGLLQHWMAAVEGGTPYNVEYRIRCHDGSYYWFNGRAIPLRNETGQIQKWFGSSTDITERKLAEQQLREHQNQYERLLKLEVASQTVAAIAHELNQPLNAAASFTDAALRFLNAGNPKPEQLSEALEQSAQQIQRGGQVIHELCRFLQVQETITEHFDLSLLVTKVLNNFEMDNNFAGFSVTAEFEKELPSVRANEIQIEKVLNNLLRNGLEAMQEAELDEGAVSLMVYFSDREGFAQITISDNGPGLSEETLKHLFQPFFTTKPKGLGIGLALSRAMVEAQGGELWVEQVTSQAIFHLILPFAKEHLS